MKKKVWVLYRVSTKMQVNADDDIPMQRIACEEFIKTHPDWVLDKELYERGVSGWRNKTEDRDELLRIKDGALKKEYDVLLVFMFDRLGRRMDESPMVVEFLVNQGIEVWSVKEGQAKLEDHSDSLVNFIRFWQSAGESKKTSIRVREAMRQMNENGLYVGGFIPYGYRVVLTDIKHPKKDKYMSKLVIDEYESTIVKLIFDLALNKGYGSSRIAKYLNDKGYKNRDRIWRHNTINRMLRNPVYMGRKRYNMNDEDFKLLPKEEWKLQPYNEELNIVTEDVFIKTQRAIDNRTLSNKENNVPTKSRFLLSGIARCGYCGKKLKVDYSIKKYRRKTDGEITTTYQNRYRCHYANNFKKHGKCNFGAVTYEKETEKVVFDIINNLKIDSFTNELNERRKENLKLLNETLKKANDQLDTKNRQLDTLNDEIANSLIGESKFTPERLEMAIHKVEVDIKKLKGEILTISKEIDKAKIEMSDMEELRNDFENWGEKYKKGTLDDKKVMLSRIIDSVYFKDKEIKFIFNFKFSQMKNFEEENQYSVVADNQLGIVEILNHDSQSKNIRFDITHKI